jgi:hypothetical protein
MAGERSPAGLIYYAALTKLRILAIVSMFAFSIFFSFLPFPAWFIKFTLHNISPFFGFSNRFSRKIKLFSKKIKKARISPGLIVTLLIW